jgi:hypothetical protein
MVRDASHVYCLRVGRRCQQFLFDMCIRSVCHLIVQTESKSAGLLSDGVVDTVSLGVSLTSPNDNNYNFCKIN